MMQSKPDMFHHLAPQSADSLPRRMQEELDRNLFADYTPQQPRPVARLRAVARLFAFFRRVWR